MTMLLRYWRELVIAAAVLALIGSCHARDNAIADKARAELLYQRADSTIQANASRLARVDTLIVRDTERVRVTVDRVTTLRDTVLSHLTDTVLVKEYVARTDTALRVCSELSSDCAQFRSFALQRFAADSTKLVALRASIPRPARCGFKCGFLAGSVMLAGVIHFTK